MDFTNTKQAIRGGGKAAQRNLKSRREANGDIPGSTTALAGTRLTNADLSQVDRILDAALAVFNDYSYAEATTNEIARRSQVTKRDLYVHFPQKQVLLFSVVARRLRESDSVFQQALSCGARVSTIRKSLIIVGLAIVKEVVSAGTLTINRLEPVMTLR